MNALEFLDSNVLLYAYDDSNRQKQRVARELLGKAVTGGAVISTQVLAEFTATLLKKKMSPPTRPEDVAAVLDSLPPIRVILPDREIVRRAVDARIQYGVHLYDGMILAAAERAGCSRIWSEDLNPGQEYFGIRIENPFS